MRRTGSEPSRDQRVPESAKQSGRKPTKEDVELVKQRREFALRFLCGVAGLIIGLLSFFLKPHYAAQVEWYRGAVLYKKHCTKSVVANSSTGQDQLQIHCTLANVSFDRPIANFTLQLSSWNVLNNERLAIVKKSIAKSDDVILKSAEDECEPSGPDVYIVCVDLMPRPDTLSIYMLAEAKSGLLADTLVRTDMVVIPGRSQDSSTQILAEARPQDIPLFWGALDVLAPWLSAIVVILLVFAGATAGKLIVDFRRATRELAPHESTPQ